MPRHLVCVTFDFDAMSGLISRGLTTPTFISRGEFGAVAVPRLLTLLRRYGIKSTFYIPGFTIETCPRDAQRSWTRSTRSRTTVGRTYRRTT